MSITFLLVGPSGDRANFRSSHFDFRFSKSANWLIFSPESVDNRYGGVRHAGVGSRARPLSPASQEPPVLRLKLFRPLWRMTVRPRGQRGVGVAAATVRPGAGPNDRRRARAAMATARLRPLGQRRGRRKAAVVHQVVKRGLRGPCRGGSRTAPLCSRINGLCPSARPSAGCCWRCR